MAKVRANGRWSVPGNSGALANGWKVNAYIAGTSTRKDTFTDYLGGTANANPVILDARGEATIYWQGIYKIVVTDEDDVTIWTENNYGEDEDAVITGNYNLVKNGSFETLTNSEPDDWTIVDYPTAGSGAGVHAIDATDQYHGLNSLKFTSVGDGGGYATSEYFEVQEAKVVPVSWAMKSSVAGVRNVVDILWYTSAKTLISTTNLFDDSTTNPTSWTAKNATGTPPSTTRYAQVRIYGCHSSDPTSGSTWYDDVKAGSDNLAYRNIANTFTKTQTWTKGADIASAAALPAQTDGNYADVTGTTTITSFLTMGVGTVFKRHFDEILILTHHATNLVLPGNANITTAAGDEIELIEYQSGDVRCLNYQKATVPPFIYEEGTWTLTLSDGVNSDATQTSSQGYFTRIGRVVYYTGRLGTSSLGSVSGSLQITGLPYTSLNVTNGSVPGVTSNVSGMAITAGQTITTHVVNNTKYMLLYLWDAPTGTTQLQHTEWSANGAAFISGFYFV